MGEEGVGIIVGPSYDQIKMNKERETERNPQSRCNQCCKKLLEIKAVAFLFCLFVFFLLLFIYVLNSGLRGCLAWD